MTDRHLFYLDADWEWDLAYDQCQWMIRRLIRRQNAIFPRALCGARSTVSIPPHSA